MSTRLVFNVNVLNVNMLSLTNLVSEARWDLKGLCHLFVVSL